MKGSEAKFAWTEAKTKSNGEVLRALLEQEPGNGGEEREAETGDEGCEEARKDGSASSLCGDNYSYPLTTIKMTR